MTHRTRYYYDLLGNLKEVRTTDGTIDGDPNPTGTETLRRVVMGYDNFGRKTSMNDPDMGAWSYQYDAAGNLLRQAANVGTPDVRTLCFKYDTLDRLTAKAGYSSNAECPGTFPTDGNNHLAAYVYDTATNGIGQLHTVSWGPSPGQNKEAFAYSSLGLLTTHTRWVDGRQYTMSYGSFDAFHRPTAITYPNGEVVTLTYDREGENSLRAGSDWLVTDIRYNARGQMTFLDRYNVADTTYTYHPQNDASGGGLGDSNFRLKTIQHGGAGTGDTWPDFTYEYDRVGNITRLTTASTAGTDVQVFSYDHLNRLDIACTYNGSACHSLPNLSIGQYNHNYDYSLLGNISQRTEKNGSSTITYGYTYGSKPHAVMSVNASSGPNMSFTYDANGNMTQRVEGGVTYQQTFNVENELASVVVSGQTTSFTYDAAGIRVKTVKPNGVVIDHPFPNYEVENPTATTPIRRSIYTIAGQTIATRVSGDPVSGNNGISYFYNDHLGSNTALRKPDGSRVATYYLPFGNYRGTAPNQTITDRDFTGQPENRELGLLYYQARFYVPSIGRFASTDTLVPDPANPQQYNRYSYVLNNALRYTDPTGHSCYNPSLGSPCVLSDGTGNSASGVPTLPSPSIPLPTNLPSEPDIPLNEANLNAFRWASQSLQWLQSQGYSLEQAIAFLLFKEVSLAFDGEKIIPVVLDAITYKYNQYCAVGAGTASCLRGFWSYYQPMLNLWNSSLLQGDRLGGIRWFFNECAANTAYLRGARQVISRPELGGQANHRPSGWASVGSTQNRATYLLLESVMIGPAQTQVFYKADSGFYDSQSWLFVVLSVDQQNYHCGGSCVTAP